MPSPWGCWTRHRRRARPACFRIHDWRPFGVEPRINMPNAPEFSGHRILYPEFRGYKPPTGQGSCFCERCCNSRKLGRCSLRNPRRPVNEGRCDQTANVDRCSLWWHRSRHIGIRHVAQRVVRCAGGACGTTRGVSASDVCGGRAWNVDVCLPLTSLYHKIVLLCVNAKIFLGFDCGGGV